MSETLNLKLTPKNRSETLNLELTPKNQSETLKFRIMNLNLEFSIKTLKFRKIGVKL